MKATNIECRLNPDGSADLVFSTDSEIKQISVAPEARPLLLSAGLLCAPDALPEHDGFRIGRMPDGLPVLQFRFVSHWLSIALGPLDLETLEDVLRRHRSRFRP